MLAISSAVMLNGTFKEYNLTSLKYESSSDEYEKEEQFDQKHLFNQNVQIQISKQIKKTNRNLLSIIIAI